MQKCLLTTMKGFIACVGKTKNIAKPLALQTKFLTLELFHMSIHSR